ncbi:hypothetical protein AM609_02685 [Actinomyces sp. oral taxon 414]|nr:hypothetical protein AM609_02685 [Actinomyces sp. oral taxon 414]
MQTLPGVGEQFLDSALDSVRVIAGPTHPSGVVQCGGQIVAPGREGTAFTPDRHEITGIERGDAGHLGARYLLDPQLLSRIGCPDEQQSAHE